MKKKHTNPYQLSNERNNIRPDTHTNKHRIIPKPKRSIPKQSMHTMACQFNDGPIAGSDHHPITLGVQLQPIATSDDSPALPATRIFAIDIGHHLLVKI